MPVPRPKRAVNTLPLSVSTCSGAPWRRIAARKASQTGLAVALGVSCAQTQKREWSSIPVTTLSSPPPSSRTPPITSICQSSIGAQALPAAVVLALPPALLRLDQAVAQEAAVDRGAAGERRELLARQVVEQRARPPARVLAAQGHDPRLDLGSHAVGAGRGAAGAVGQGGDAAGGVPAQPAVHRLARDPVPARHLGDGEALHDLQDCPVTLLHDSQLDQHGCGPPSSPTFSGRLFEVGLAPAFSARRCNASTGASVARLPEPRPGPVAHLPEPMWKGCTGTAHARFLQI